MHETHGPWHGRAAATMYEQLRQALARAYGECRKYIVAEDGDTKGYQSNRGKAAKQKARITAMKLPPRSPGWMPLDFCLWDEIEARVLAKRDRGDESMDAYKKRLAITAKRLPRQMVENCLAGINTNTEETVTSRGRHMRVD